MNHPALLIVEDELLITECMISLLQLNDYLILGSVTNGFEAIEMALSKHPDAILMDINLKSEMNGIETAEKICIEEDIPIIFVTANAEALEGQKLKYIKYHDLIFKPFHNDQLFYAIDRAFEWSLKIKENKIIEASHNPNENSVYTHRNLNKADTIEV